MSSVNIPNQCRSPIQSAYYFRNGHKPEAGTQTYMATETNRILRWRTKALDFVTPIPSIPTLTGASRARWRGVYHSSSHAWHMWVRFFMAQTPLGSGAGGGSDDPYGLLTVKNGAGTTIGTAELHAGASPAASVTDVPNHFRNGLVELTSSGVAVELTPDTDYYLYFTDEQGGRMIAAEIYEESLLADTDNGYADASAVAMSPIFDADRADVVPLLRTAWKRNASGLWYWSSDTDATAPTRSANTLANIFDQTVTTVTSTSPGVKTDVTYCSTVRRAAAGTNCVPVAWFVYAKMTPAAGTNGHVKLVDTTGFVAQDIPITSTTAAWYSATFSIPNGNNKLDLQLKGDGTNSCVVYASSLFQYEA